MKMSLFTVSVIISFSAWANSDEQFEALLLASAISTNSDLSSEQTCRLCLDQDVKVSQRNFERLQSGLEKQAQACLANQMAEDTLLYELERQSALSQKRISPQVQRLFPAYHSSALRCENMVVDLFAPSLQQLQRGVEEPIDPHSFKRRYQDEVDIYQRFVIQACQPMVALRNCLIDNSYSARYIYNSLRQSEGLDAVSSSRSLSHRYSPSGDTHIAFY